MPLAPKRVMHRKVQRGKQHGFATRDNHIDFGEIALVAMEPAWLNARVIEACRVAISRKLDRKGNIWIRVFPDKPTSRFLRSRLKSAWVRVRAPLSSGLPTLSPE